MTFHAHTLTLQSLLGCHGHQSVVRPVLCTRLPPVCPRYTVSRHRPAAPQDTIHTKPQTDYEIPRLPTGNNIGTVTGWTNILNLYKPQCKCH